LLQMGLADENRLHVHAATRTKIVGLRLDFLACNRRAAMRTKLRSRKNHPETRRTRHNRQPRTAMLALRRVGGNRRAARRAIHCYRISHLQMLYVRMTALPMPFHYTSTPNL